MLDTRPDSRGSLRFAGDIPPRTAETVPWPEWVHPRLLDALRDAGVAEPWRHQAVAAELAHAGTHVVIATGTASGKSLAYQLPVVGDLAADPRATALYISPTKALGADQVRAIERLLDAAGLAADIGACTVDGDTSTETRGWAREYSRWVFTNPDMLHASMLRGHTRWARLLRNLRYVVVDECHAYRGVFGSHVALVLRRLRRLAQRYGADPVFVFASATTSEPGAAAARLIGSPVEEVVDDASPHGGRTIALWEPAATGSPPVRRSAPAESALLLADLVREGARTLAFVRSRRAAEITSLAATHRLRETAPHFADRIASYRAGYLPEDRRDLERRLADGDLLGAATTNALELGVDIAGLDAVVVAGFPGSVASFWQQGGRSGRRGEGSLVVLVARDDPLDTYLVDHPEALLGRPIEATVTDPGNPYVLGPHLLCAAAEHPLTHAEAESLDAQEVLANLAAQGLVRRRPQGWFIVPGADPHSGIDIRGGIGHQVAIVDGTSGRLLGTIDAARAPATVHPGAVHIHRGESFVVDSLDLDDGVALAHPEEPEWTTSPRSTTEISVLATLEHKQYASVSVGLADVEVTGQVVGYLRTLPGGEVIDNIALDMPSSTLHTRAVMYTIEQSAFAAIGLSDERIPGALHAAEHAAIGMLPLVATCDRIDIGGVSTALHADTMCPTVFVYDGHPGGAGFAERGHREFTTWLTMTRDAIAACPCGAGCPSCVHSPKCGNGNEPLDKYGAVAVLDLLLSSV
nr:DEAD/DEAH box helicase [Rhodococcus rhodnii]